MADLLTFKVILIEGFHPSGKVLSWNIVERLCKNCSHLKVKTFVRT